MPTSSRKHTSRPLRLYLIDAHPLIRLGLRSFFDTQPSVSIEGDASTLAAALPALRLCKPDVVITDTFPMPKRVLNRQRFRVLYTFETLEHCSPAKLTQHLKHGRAGIALKNLPMNEFLRAVDQVAAGRGNNDPAFLCFVEEKRRRRDTVRQMRRNNRRRSNRRKEQKKVKTLRQSR